MHSVEQKVLQRFAAEPSRELSTTELVKSVFLDEYEEVKKYLYNDPKDPEVIRLGKRRKARLHRKILYHLGLMVEENILKVTRTEGRGEKYFALNPDKEIKGKKDAAVKTVLDSMSSMKSDMFLLSGLESYEETKMIHRFDPQNWITKINSLIIEASARQNLKEIYSLVMELYPIYNDVLGINHFELLVESEDLESLNSFLKKVKIDTMDYNKQVNLIIDLTKVKDTVKLTDFITAFTDSNPEKVYVIFQANSKAMNSQTRFMRQLVKSFSDQKIRINIQNIELHKAPYIVGRAGVYTFNDSEWAYYESSIKGKTIGLCCSEASISIDVNRFFKQNKSYTEFRELIMKAARAMLLGTTVQRKKSDIFFKTLDQLNGQYQNKFFMFSHNYIRLWNYDLTMDEENAESEAKSKDGFNDFEALIKDCTDQIDEFCKNEETIFKSCGIPIRFNIVLSSAFKRFDRDMLSPRIYKKITIKSVADFQSPKVIDYIRKRESMYKIFKGGDRVRFFRTPSFIPDDVISEITFLINTYNLHMIAYDFKSRKGELTLDNFMGELI